MVTSSTLFVLERGFPGRRPLSLGSLSFITLLCCAWLRVWLFLPFRSRLQIRLGTHFVMHRGSDRRWLLWSIFYVLFCIVRLLVAIQKQVGEQAHVRNL